MNKLVYHSLFITVYAVLYSILEIEIEGKDGGWAKFLPTVPSGLGELTVYHVIMNLIVILTVVYSTYSVSKNPFLIVFFVVAWFLLEDFFWFVLNPYFTLKKYTKKDIWWHGRQPWLLGSPMHNWVGIISLILLACLSGKKNIYQSFLVMLIIGGATILGAPLYHSWYKETHEK